MKYDWILFDADETLFSFNSYLGLKVMLERYQVPFSEADYQAFQAVNKPLWVAYQNKEITADELRDIRFRSLAEKTGQTTQALNEELMNEMALVSRPLPQVREMLEALHGKLKMAIITNGFSSLQAKRLANTDTAHFFEFVMVSEETGVAKPDPKIFECCFAKMGDNLDLSRVLMVGDTLASDILGGQRMGLDTCWVNHLGKNESDIQPTYEIQQMLELLQIIQ